MPQEYLHVRQALGFPALAFPVAARAVRDDLFNVVVLLDGETPVGCARVLGGGEPKTGAHGTPVLFLHPKDFCGTLVELEETAKDI